jgi:hypothetical protein
MPEIIDKKLAELARQGLIPKRIYLGINLYNEIRNDQFEPFATGRVTSDGGEAIAYPAEEPTEYKGIKLHLVEDKDPDHLEIET